MRFHAYDHRPDEGIAISEKGVALLSGEQGFDPGTREILLNQLRIDALEFDRDNPVTKRLSGELRSQRVLQVGQQIRSPLPQHPYVLPFREHLRDLSYDGNSINLVF